MAEEHDPGKESSQQREFMREKIVKPPLTKRQVAERALAFFFAAVMFGVVAAASFVVTRPAAEKMFGKGDAPESVPITIPRDEQDTLSQTLPSVQESPAETEPVEDMLRAALEDYTYTAEDLNAMCASLRGVGQEADKGIVIVHSVKVQTDWFDNPVEKTGLYAGAVVASSNGELLILTPDAAVEQADSIRVTFNDGTEAAGAIKQTDKVAGMAIVSVPSDTLAEEVLNEVVPLGLGNSYSMKQGDILIAVGSPAGMVHSTEYGFISYVARNVQAADGVSRVLYTNLTGNAQTGTFLINTSGQIIGWVTDDYRPEDGGGMTTVTSISDYKAILEKLTNGIQAPYFGIKGQEVNSAMVDGGMPEGVYVVNSITDAPAYNAGIQNGDIITRMGGRRITTINEFQTYVEELTVGEVVPVTVQRNGRDAYKEIEFQVTIGPR